MDKLLLRLFLCGVFAGIPMLSAAQKENDPAKTVFWGNADAFLDRQAVCMFDLIEQTLKECPPAIGQPLPRKLALYGLDAMLHETRYDESEALHRFMEARIASALEDMSRPLEDGMRIYKLYNDGFVVRTKTVTVAFDLYRGRTLIPDSFMQAVVDKCDIMFITHLHGDHADPQVAEMFRKAGKPVWVPVNLWEGNTSVKHVRSEKLMEEEVKLGSGKKLKVQIFPGHQDQLLNNVYVVTTPDGFCVAHTGDQYNEKDMEWIAGAKKQIPALDVLLVNCWTLRLKDFVDGFDPRLVITGHENEMGHSIDHREPYWLSYQKLGKIDKDYVLMTWGEYYGYTK